MLMEANSVDDASVWLELVAEFKHIKLHYELMDKDASAMWSLCHNADNLELDEYQHYRMCIMSNPTGLSKPLHAWKIGQRQLELWAEQENV